MAEDWDLSDRGRRVCECGISYIPAALKANERPWCASGNLVPTLAVPTVVWSAIHTCLPPHHSARPSRRTEDDRAGFIQAAIAEHKNPALCNRILSRLRDCMPLLPEHLGYTGEHRPACAAPLSPATAVCTYAVCTYAVALRTRLPCHLVANLLRSFIRLPTFFLLHCAPQI